MTGSNKLSTQNREKTEQLYLRPGFVERQTSALEQDLLGWYLRGPPLMMRATKPKQCLRKGEVEETSPSQGEISFVQKARWIISPWQHEEDSLRGTHFPRDRKTEVYQPAPSKLLSSSRAYSRWL